MANDDVNVDRRRFLVQATSTVGAVGAIAAAVPFVGSWSPSAKAKALGAPVELNIAKLEEGAMMMIGWRGKPVYVVRRPQAVLDNLPNENKRLSDPDSQISIAKKKQPAYIEGDHRSIKPNVLVVLAVCTHLSCAPKFLPEVKPETFDAEWQGGFYCPCHGSKFDLAGRVHSGVPAPRNLDIPPHYYKSDDVLVIGLDGETA